MNITKATLFILVQWDQPTLPVDLKSLASAGLKESLSICVLLKASDGEAFDEV